MVKRGSGLSSPRRRSDTWPPSTRTIAPRPLFRITWGTESFGIRIFKRPMRTLLWKRSLRYMTACSRIIGSKRLEKIDAAIKVALTPIATTTAIPINQRVCRVVMRCPPHRRKLRSNCFQSRPHVRDGFILPVPHIVFGAREGARHHAVDIEGSVQVVDLMLQDARVPATRLNADLLPLMIEAFHPHGTRTWHSCRVSPHTQAAFTKVH